MFFISPYKLKSGPAAPSTYHSPHGSLSRFSTYEVPFVGGQTTHSTTLTDVEVPLFHNYSTDLLKLAKNWPTVRHNNSSETCRTSSRSELRDGRAVPRFSHWRVRGRGPASPGGAFHPHPRKCVQRKNKEPTGKWRKLSGTESKWPTCKTETVSLYWAA